MVMGNASGRKDGEGPSEVYNFQGDDGYVEPMAHSPPHSPRAFHPSLFFTSQNPRDPLPRPAEALSQHSVYNEYVHNEKLIRAKISWNHGGRQVAITGSWDNWETSELMQSIGTDFVILKLLPSGLYQYRFIVDGSLRCAADLPWVYDNSGSAYNVLDLQECVSDLRERLAKFESPPSPPSSYDNRRLSEDDFSKPPPEVPPQLQEAFLNKPSSSNGGDQPLPMPHHSQLNHLHIQNHVGGKFFALSSTHRFRQKLVTAVLYKPLRRANH
ncbi:PREDICTED: SNF1-related protein kinase regulatory subunit beta-2-like [Prunus mume]|uniref:SNF1-related protein kinase regulatory subunit beta-2-like n=1 Tax=Prunus mume TaxID=102107 RepID=A0ABM1LP72_PRUMU|nr:PREDICTED: SNF1-related protein kinase regulatory subunit beta-2-like [Prunus mume]